MSIRVISWKKFLWVADSLSVTLHLEGTHTKTGVLLSILINYADKSCFSFPTIENLRHC